MEVDPNKPPKKSWKRFQRTPISYKSLSRGMKNAEKVSVRHARKFIVKRLENLKASRRVIMTWLIAVAVVLLGTVAQYMMYDRALTTTASQPGGTYAEGVLGMIDTLDPLFSSSNAELSANKLLFSSLYSHDKTGTLRPDVAESMKIDKSSKVYTVTVRQDVKWHDGKPLTANDVDFTIKTIQNPASTVNSVLRTNWMDIKTKVIDENTIKFILPSRYAAFPGALTFPIIPKHILGDVPASTIGESAFSRSPVGSGPFEFKLLQVTRQDASRKVLYLTANDAYYRGQPNISRFELHTYENNDQLLSALKTSEVAAINDADLTNVDLDESMYNETYQSINNGVYLMFNSNNTILKSKDVRVAIRAGIDTEKIRGAAENEVKPLHLPFIASQVNSKNLPKAPLSNIEKSKQLLSKAGWKLPKDAAIRQKGKMQLNFRLTTIKNAQNKRVIAELQRQLSELGIAITVESIDITSPAAGFVQNVLQPRNFDLLLHELPIGSDPDVYSYWHSSQTGVSGYNFANYQSKTADAALTTARDRVEKRLRDIKYTAFAKQWISDAPAVGLYQQSITYVTKKPVKAMDKNIQLITSAGRYVDVNHWTVNEGVVYKTP